MTTLRVDIADYDPASGLRFPVVPGAFIEAAQQHPEYVIRANAAGLRLLAFQLLTMAQDGVPAGSHLHFDPDASLEPGSAPFVIERIEPAI